MASEQDINRKRPLEKDERSDVKPEQEASSARATSNSTTSEGGEAINNVTSSDAETPDAKEEEEGPAAKKAKVLESSTEECFSKANEESSEDAVAVAEAPKEGVSNEKASDITEEIPAALQLSDSAASTMNPNATATTETTNPPTAGVHSKDSEVDAEGRIGKPSNDDILLGRGKPFQNHPGNQRMLQIVDDHKERYLSEKRDKKRAIVEEVLDVIQKDGARFLKRIDHGEYWRQVSPTVSFEKVSHALRSKVRRPEGFEIRNNAIPQQPKGPLPILPEGASNAGNAGGAMQASLYPHQQQLLQHRPMYPDSTGLGIMPPSFMPPLYGGLMPNGFFGSPPLSANPLMRGMPGISGVAPNGAPAAAGSDLEQLVRSQMVDSLLRQRQQLDEALNDVAGGMRLPPYK